MNEKPLLALQCRVRYYIKFENMLLLSVAMHYRKEFLMNKKSFTPQLVVMALLIAFEIVLTRLLSINTPIVRIGFGFMPVVVNAMIFGPVRAGTCYAAGDIIGAVLFPTGGYFPGFTLTAFFAGAVYGIFLHKKEIKWLNVILAAGTVTLILNLSMDTLWLYILTNTGVVALIVPRIVKAGIMFLIQTVVIKLLADHVVTRLPIYKSLKAH